MSGTAREFYPKSVGFGAAAGLAADTGATLTLEASKNDPLERSGSRGPRATMAANDRSLTLVKWVEFVLATLPATALAGVLAMLGSGAMLELGFAAAATGSRETGRAWRRMSRSWGGWEARTPHAAEGATR
jgi:hypothetical protein